MSLYNGAQTIAGVYSEEFEVRVGVHQGSKLSPVLFAIVSNVITEKVRRNEINKVLYADDPFLMSEPQKT